MAAPVMVETFTIPLKTKKVKPTPEKNNNNNNTYEKTGFPFDDSDFGGGERERDRSFRSHIDDIVQRHPELAEHLNFDRNFDRFPFRSNTWGHKRRGSASTGDESRPCGSTEYPESRRFGRPFGSRFEERFGFPFSKTFDGEPEYYHQQKGQPQPQAQPKPQTQQEQQPQPQPQPPNPQPQEAEKVVQPEEKPPQVPNNDRGRKQNPNLPQSSTVDLGQKQDPVYDTRGQRSMSAPPENRAGQPRYVSSINIPMGGGDPNAQPQPQPQQQWQQPPPQQQQPKPHATQQSKSTERVIPIHVEGRDEPVIPKRGANAAFTQPPPQPERVFPQAPPQQERVFGQRPAGFGHWDRGDAPYYSGEQFFPGDQQFFGDPQQYFEGGPQFFMNRGGEPAAAHQQQQRPEEYFPGPFRQQQKQQAQPPQPQQKPQPPPPQQQQQHQQQPAAPAPPPPQQQQQQTTPPPQPQPPKGPIDQIHCIQKDVLQLMDQVEKFNGQPRDKQYLYLDEMLTRDLLKLDDIDTEGKENIRLARKEAINCIQRCISILEAKAAANEQIRNQLMDVDAKLENPGAAVSSEPIPLGSSLEVSGVSRSGTEVTVNEQPEQTDNSETPMEVSPPPSATTENVEAKVEEAAEPEAVEAKKLEDAVPMGGDPPSDVKEGEQSNEEKKVEEATSASEQPADESSQTTEATKEEVKDKKEKKKVKKKADKTEKK